MPIYGSLPGIRFQEVTVSAPSSESVSAECKVIILVDQQFRCWLLIAEARVKFRVILCEIHDRRNAIKKNSVALVR
jgi:hypothetical protein